MSSMMPSLIPGLSYGPISKSFIHQRTLFGFEIGRERDLIIESRAGAPSAGGSCCFHSFGRQWWNHLRQVRVETAFRSRNLCGVSRPAEQSNPSPVLGCMAYRAPRTSPRRGALFLFSFRNSLRRWRCSRPLHGVYHTGQRCHHIA